MSNTVVPLGRLQPVPLRQAWPDEARNFTPWLAEAENLALLGEELGLNLEHEATETAVGPFAADILARDIYTGGRVLIENQLEATDHIHLGQLLTYAAGLDARTVIWVAESFREQHRAALDWLNQATAEGFNFFAVQIELYRIGESAYAPSFNVVAKPNDWTRQVTAAARSVEANDTPAKQRWRKYWGTLIAAAKAANLPLGAFAVTNSNWQIAEWLRGAPPRIGLYVTVRRKSLRLSVYIDGPAAKQAYAAFEAQKVEMERICGASLEFDPLPRAQGARIELIKAGEDDVDNEINWAGQHTWFIKWLPPFSAALKSAMQEIDFDNLSVDEPAV